MKVHGEVHVPGDKSISHRALMLGALSASRSVVRGILRSTDVQSTASVLRSLGATIPPLGDVTEVDGRGIRGLTASPDALDCGNSGTTARLMTGILSGHPFDSRLVGDESLSRRPMRRVAEPLSRMGARFEFDGAGERLPMTIHGGALQPIEWTTETASAQVKSAILLAGVVAGIAVTVREPAPSRDHTERMLSALGQTVMRNGTEVTLDPQPFIDAFDITVPGDPSSAAFFAALAALANTGLLRIPNVCLNPTRTGFYSTLARMGADVRLEQEGREAGEAIGAIHVTPAPLHGVRVGEDDVPSMIDELPLLACVAARAAGETVIEGAAELRVKESDRIAVMVSNLRAVGVDAEELPDGMRIVGKPGAKLGGRIATHGDHRIAMAFGVLGAATGGAITPDDRTCVAVSFPGFWRDLDRVVE